MLKEPFIFKSNDGTIFDTFTLIYHKFSSSKLINHYVNMAVSLYFLLKGGYF